MIAVHTAALSGAALDWAVAIACGFKGQIAVTDYGDGKEECFFAYPVRDAKDQVIHARGDRFKPSTNGALAVPIIELLVEEGFIVQKAGFGLGVKVFRVQGDLIECQYGATTLIAAMRCYVAWKLGDKVGVPETLL